MARLIFSNDEKIVKDFTTHCESVGFDKHTLFSNKGRTIGASFQKLCIDNKNCFTIGDDIVTIVGTYIYKEKTGEDACRLVYEDFKNTNDLMSIRDSIWGHFAMIIVCDGILKAISDNLGVHYFYYHINKETGKWIIGTSLYEMVKVAPFECHVDEFNLIEESYSHCVFGDETIFQEFNKVTGEKYCKVNLNNGDFEVLEASKPQFLIDNRTSDEIANDLSKELASYGKLLKTLEGENGTALCMTGGIDARLTLAMLLHTGNKPTLYYGIGNSKLTNTKAGDLEVDKMLATEFGLQLHLMDYKNERKLGKNWDTIVEKYGFLDHFSTVTSNLKKEFEAISQPLQIWNFFGEMFRNVDLTEKNNTTEISVDEIISNHYVMERNLRPMLGEKFESYRRHIFNKLCKVLNPYLNENGKLPLEYFVVYDYYRRINCDTHKMNMCNQYRYCVAPLGDWRFLKYMTTPVNIRDDAQLLLRTIDNLYPQLLDVPFFSHQHWRIYDKDSVKLNTTDVDSSKEKLMTTSPLNSLISAESGFRKTKLWSCLRKVKPLILFILNPMGYKKSQDARESLSMGYIIEQLTKMCNEYPDFKYKVDLTKSDYLPKDAHLILLLFTLNKVKARILYH